MRTDPHSYADLEQARTRAVDWEVEVDFDAKVLWGRVRLDFEQPAKGVVDLDSRGLRDLMATDIDGNTVRIELGEPDPVLGTRVRLHLERPVDGVVLTYATSPNASGLMWLDRSQTDSGAHPFMLSQCQAVHARSLLPLQDTPEGRITYTATVTVPEFATAVMSAAPGEVLEEEGTRTFRFAMPQPIPPYLMALAVGELTSHDLGPRCRVFAEPGVIEAAAWEFEDVERMLTAAEGLFGPYAWDRYDFIVLPPSFPLGGMENPRMTFLTPTLIAGDRSLVGVLAHELAHSWTGNLVTNANNEHFWLNEGWTMWAERRILEALYGAEEATQQAMLGRHELEETMASRVELGQSNALEYSQHGLDPDDEFSQVPYEKGFLFLTAVERLVDRERFEAFVATYIDTFRFQSITTSIFEAFLREQLPEVEAMDLDVWFHGQGIPADAPVFHSDKLEGIVASATAGDVVDGTSWTATEKLTYLAHLTDEADAHAVAEALDLVGSTNAELVSSWLSFALRSGADGLEDQIRDFVDRVGRTKLLRPVFKAMMRRPELHAFAGELFDSNAPRLHHSTRTALRVILRR